jgi:hypothetical protein
MTDPESTQQNLHDQKVNRGCLGCLLIFSIPPLLMLAFVIVPHIFSLIFTKTFAFTQVPIYWDDTIKKAAYQAIEIARENDSFNGLYHILPNMELYPITRYQHPDNFYICDDPAYIRGAKLSDLLAFKIGATGGPPSYYERWVCVDVRP